MQSLYESDFYGWAKQQVQLLRDQKWNQIDLNYLIEEIESLGRQERQQLRNRLSILIAHLLKWEYQPTKRSRSWLATIRVQRIDLEQLLEDSPSLKPYLTEALQKAYLKSLELASSETNLPLKTFPSECLYTLEQVLDNCFYPGEPSKELEEY
ncbi:MAG TPA: DUF29 domain-containing protein [Planktothrix sp. UBA8407]|jgi:Domain of unknown function DUF29.|nr:DUF29 domain-containing protein [Planktothrix sp. UBA8407]